MEEKGNQDRETDNEGGRQIEGEGERDHLSRGEPSEELDCMPLAGVIVKAP